MDSEKNPVRKIYQMGTTHVVVLAAPLVKKLGLDEDAYVEEQVTPEGNILLRVRKLQP